VYADDQVRVELACSHGAVLSGVWELELRVDGRPLRQRSAWQEVCRQSDKEVDYLELASRWEEGVRVERHLMLARKDLCLLAADAVLGCPPGRLDYRGSLPLAEAVAFQPAAKTWEGFLVARRRVAAVIPLALPEWRAGDGVGSLSAVGCRRGTGSLFRRGASPTDSPVAEKRACPPSAARLELRQAGDGRALFAPLWLDLCPRRMRCPLTWRQLTVGERLAAVSRDRAVGYRVRVGSRQWLIYRSLGRTGSRSVLGHNLVSEFLVARFGRKGQVEAIVEIE